MFTDKRDGRGAKTHTNTNMFDTHRLHVYKTRTRARASKWQSNQ